MKKVVIVCLFLTFSMLAFAQGPNNCGQGTWPVCQYLASTDTSATALTIPSNGGLKPSFEYKWTGSLTNVSTVITGCTALGKCDTLDTYSGTTAVIRTTAAGSMTTAPVASYNYFTVTSTYTGTGTFTVYFRNIIAY